MHLTTCQMVSGMIRYRLMNSAKSTEGIREQAVQSKDVLQKALRVSRMLGVHEVS